MTTLLCGYTGDRDEALVTYLYDDGDADSGERALFAAHVNSCARCRDDLDALRGVRTQLARWTPPEPHFAAADRPSAVRSAQWWRQIPAWAQVAAALLFLGVSAGIANLDVRYDQSGLSVRTGWRQPPVRETRPGGQGPLNVSPGAAGVVQGSPMTQGSAVAPAAAGATSAPWRADLAALERQLRTELRSVQTSAAAASPQGQPARTTAGDAEVIRRVRALLDESEKRQQSELALRVAEVVREVNAQRQADLVKIDRTLGTVQNNLGVEVLKNRQQLNQMNLLYRASQRQ